MAPPAMPAMTTLPSFMSSDTSTNRKFYTVTASLREIYDDNVSTSNTNSKTSFETDVSPSFLVDFPNQNDDFSARYTFDMTYYTSPPSGNNGGGSGNGGSMEYTHEFVAQYMHAFSDRFDLNLGDQFRYYTEPSLFEATGTNYENGPYIANTGTAMFTAQWTPLFATTTTFANTIVSYEDTTVANDQNNMENTGSQTFSYSLLPKINLTFGGIADNITYDTALRGYSNYTGFAGFQWQALPSLSVTGRGGASYTEPNGSRATIGPYGALSIIGTLGKRSSFSFDYAHEVTPTDEVGANGQTSDRFSANLKYDITPSLSAHLQGIFTVADVSRSLINSAALSSYTEYDYALDTGFTYHCNHYLDFSLGAILSGVSSGLSINDYSRDQVYLGVRGTY